MVGQPAGPVPRAGTVTVTDLARFVPSATTVAGEPDNVAVVGLPANFVSSATTETIPGTILGRALTIRFTPVNYAFDYGDGERRDSATAGSLLGGQRSGPVHAHRHEPRLQDGGQIHRDRHRHLQGRHRPRRRLDPDQRHPERAARRPGHPRGHGAHRPRAGHLPGASDRARLLNERPTPVPSDGRSQPRSFVIVQQTHRVNATRRTRHESPTRSRPHAGA